MKKGLEYFPMDVDMFQDIRIRKLIKRQGGKAISVYTLLLCIIYRDGYYTRWDEELPFIISEQTGFEEAYIREAIKCCISLGLFNEKLFTCEKVLTSRSIQERYMSIRKTMKRIIRMDAFNLISSEETGKTSEDLSKTSEETGKTSEDLSKTSEETGKTSEKFRTMKEGEKERTEKEKISPVPPSLKEKEKEKKKSVYAAGAAALLESRKKIFYDSLVPYVQKYGRELIREFFDYWTEPNKSQTKMRFELEKTWDISRRLSTWSSRDKQFNHNGANRTNNSAERTVNAAADAIRELLADNR